MTSRYQRTTVLSARDFLTAGLAGCLAAIVTLRGMVAGGFAGVPGNLEDGRLNAFLLEHSWGWLARAPGHQRLWGLPAFFPAGDNALAWSDAMVSFGFLYWPWRALGLAPDTSYQMWTLAVIAFNVFACHLFLRFALGASPPAAALGAWLAACSASHLHHLSHSQLLPLFFVIGALGGTLAWARIENAGRRRLAAAGATAAIVAQLYGGFYLGLFGALTIAAMGLVALGWTRPRRLVLEGLERDWIWLSLIAVVAALALVPWYLHYSAAYGLVGAPPSEQVATMLPRARSWLFVSPSAWAYHWTARSDFFRSLPWGFEHAVGLGFFTTALVLVAVVTGRRRTAVRLTACSAVLLMATTTMLPGGFSVWGWLVELVPPLAAARAVARIGLLLPLAAAVILVSAVDRAGRRSSRAALLLGLALAGSEQLCRLRLYDKATQRYWVGQIVERIDPEARSFVLTRRQRVPGAVRLHLDAMWAASITGRPTVNGHSGNSPPGWGGLRMARLQNEAQREEFRAALDAWLASHGVASDSVQWIEAPPGYRGRQPPRTTLPARQPRLERVEREAR